MKAPDFDRKMLLVATQISHQSEMKSVLLAVLESLLKTLKVGSNGDAIVEAMTLMRCIVRLVLNLLLEPAANKYSFYFYRRLCISAHRCLRMD